VRQIALYPSYTLGGRDMKGLLFFAQFSQPAAFRFVSGLHIFSLSICQTSHNIERVVYALILFLVTYLMRLFCAGKI